MKAARGASVGLAVWGHPLFSPLARAVEAEAARKGVPCRLMAANSPVSTALARSQTFLGFLPKQYFGLQAYEAESFLSDPPRPARRLPLVVFSERVVDTRRLSAALARRWPSDHKVCVCPYDDGKLRLTSVKALAGDWDGRGAMVCIFP